MKGKRGETITPIYHITHIYNLRSIVEKGGLCCDNTRVTEAVDSIGIAHSHIKERRAKRNVPVKPGGVVADYVPFYFAPRSPMLYAIHCNAVEGFNGNQNHILHLVSSAEQVMAKGLPFVFTNGHAEMLISRFFRDLSDLDKVDWEIMQDRVWRDTNEDGDRKRRRQAEFLVHRFFPSSLFSEIGVANKRMAQEVELILNSLSLAIPITVHSDWYY